MATWKWIEDGQSVEITTDSREILQFKGAPTKESEWRGYYDRIADDGEALAILRSARAAFKAGMAEYTNARENLKSLLRELAGANAAVFTVALDVDVFFTPPGIVKAFGRDRQGLIDFAMEFVARAYTRKLSGSGE